MPGSTRSASIASAFSVRTISFSSGQSCGRRFGSNETNMSSALARAISRFTASSADFDTAGKMPVTCRKSQPNRSSLSTSCVEICEAALAAAEVRDLRVADRGAALHHKAGRGLIRHRDEIGRNAVFRHALQDAPADRVVAEARAVERRMAEPRKADRHVVLRAGDRRRKVRDVLQLAGLLPP